MVHRHLKYPLITGKASNNVGNIVYHVTCVTVKTIETTTIINMVAINLHREFRYCSVWCAMYGKERKHF